MSTVKFIFNPLSGQFDAVTSTIDLTADVTGILPVANGGTGSGTTAGALSSLGALPTAGGTMSGAIAMGSNKITGLASGTASGDAVQFGQVGVANGVASLDGSGLIPITQLPPAAIERLVIVANQTARYALTTATVQNGDTVLQSDTNVMYFVVDQTNLGNAAGYQIYSAGTASAVAWSGITGVPAPVSSLSGTNTGDVTLGTANGLSLASQVLSLGLSSTSTTGALSSTDWNTFNGKGSGTVTSVSVASANGLAGTSSGGATPILTLSTTITGYLQGNGTSISAAATSGANSLVTRDANANATANNLVQGYATTVTSAATKILTAASPQQQYFTGVTAGQQVKLPDATTLALGTSYTIVNNSTQIITLEKSDATTIQSMAAGTTVVVTVTDISTAAGVWSYQYINYANTTLSNLGTTAINASLIPNGVTPALGTSGTNWKYAYITNLISPTIQLTAGGTVLLDTSMNISDLSGKNAIQTNNRLLKATDGTTTLLDWSSTNLRTAVAPVVGNDIVNKTYADAVNPLTTKGDIAVFSTIKDRLPVGTNNQVLIADSTQATGLRWGGSVSTTVAPTVQKFTTGSGTYTTPTNPAPMYIRVRMVGGGAGGGGSNVGSPTNAGAGGNTTFGTTLLVANGGAANSGATAGAGGSASLGSGPIGTALQGGWGSEQEYTPGAGIQTSGGGHGASSPFGGAGNGPTAAAGNNAIANTGSGGGGGGNGGTSNFQTGPGGSAGGYVDAIISSPSATYSYTVGAGGSAGAAGTSGYAGGAGGSGYIEVVEYYASGGINLPTFPTSSVQTTTYAVLTTDSIVLLDASGGSFTTTLPTAVGIKGTQFTLKNVGTANAITIATTSAQTIDGIASGVILMATPKDYITVVSDGSNWKVINWGILVYAEYNTTASTTITNNTATTIQYDTKVTDTQNNVTTGASWAFTATVPGTYQIDGAIGWAPASNVDWLGAAYVLKNGSSSKLTFGINTHTAASTAYDVIYPIAATMKLAATDTIRIQGAASTGANRNLAGSALENWITITRIGN